MASRSSPETFSRYFSVHPVEPGTPSEEEVYRVRYQVYCQEFGYEPSANFPDGKETDGFDHRSRHCLVVHKPSGHSAGCVRLVHPDPDDRDSLLPFEQNCGDSLDREKLARLDLPRSTVCEISRLAVSRTFRGRAGEDASKYGAVSGLKFTESERRVFPYIAVSLYLAATVLTELTGRRNVFAMMEPFLPRLLNRVGIHFQQVGPVIDYHGQRAPYFITTDSALEGMKPDLRELYERVRRSLAPDLPRSTARSQPRERSFRTYCG
jgi:N-acyl amino acid synthase of PEP-CTERM/exosortase system